MKPRKPKPAEPSTRDKLSASFLKAFQNDFETYGVETIEKLREESPSKYAEIAAKLIAAIEPKAEGFEACKNMRDVGISLLKSVGVSEYEITEDMIAEALKGNDEFINALQAIRAAAEGQMQ